MSMICFTYIILGIIALWASIVVVSAINPIHRIALLIIVFMAGAFMYTLLDFYFLGLTYIIVYVGAIAILFLFVIMMVKASEETLSPAATTTNSDQILTSPTATTIIAGSYRVTKPYINLTINSNSSIINTYWFIIVSVLISIMLAIWVTYIAYGENILPIDAYKAEAGFTYSILTTTICTYFFPSWAVEYYSLTDLSTLGYVVYVVYPLALVLIALALWIVMIGIIASIGL